MRTFAAATLLACVLFPGVVQGQQRLVIETRADADEESYAYRPETVTAKAGDILVFRGAEGENHAVSFERAISPAARQALNSAMPNRVGDLAGPLVPGGREYRITVPANLPAGRYRFFCLPHRAYDEAGWLVIEQRR